MVHLVSTPQPSTRAPQPANRIALALVAGGAGLGALFLIGALILWGRYGTAVFFEMIAAGLAACF